MEREPQLPGGRFQIRLWDLVVVVVGASYVLDVTRRSRVAWGGGWPDLSHAVGLTVLTFGVGVGLVVAGQWVRRFREHKGRAWALIWRVIAVGWLAWALVEVDGALQTESTTGVRRGFGDHSTMRLRLTTLMAALGMVGMILAAAPLRTYAASFTLSRKPRWGSWPTVTLAALIGIVLLGLGHGMIPYLVLIALEAVWNALSRAPLLARPSLIDRLTMSSLEVLPGLIGCLWTAVWIDDDLRTAARDPIDARSPRSWPGVIVRFATVALAVSGSAYVLLVSIPKLDPCLAEGLATEIDPSTIATVVLGFAALAAGFSARAAAHLVAVTDSSVRPVARESASRWFGPWSRRLIGGIVALVSLEITAAAVQMIRRDPEYRWYIPWSFEFWILKLPSLTIWFGQTGGASGWHLLIDRPDVFLIGIAAIWLTIQLVAILRSRHSSQSSPLDTLVTDRLALGRFLGWWIGLTIAMVASLPGLAILGVTFIHFLVRWVAR